MLRRHFLLPSFPFILNNKINPSSSILLHQQLSRRSSSSSTTNFTISAELNCPEEDLCDVSIRAPTPDQIESTPWYVVTQSRDKNLIVLPMNRKMAGRYLREFGSFGVKIPIEDSSSDQRQQLDPDVSSSPSTSGNGEEGEAQNESSSGVVRIWNHPDRCGWTNYASAAANAEEVLTKASGLLTSTAASLLYSSSSSKTTKKKSAEHDYQEGSAAADEETDVIEQQEADIDELSPLTDQIEKLIQSNKNDENETMKDFFAKTVKEQSGMNVSVNAIRRKQKNKNEKHMEQYDPWFFFYKNEGIRFNKDSGKIISIDSNTIKRMVSIIDSPPPTVEPTPVSIFITSLNDANTLEQFATADLMNRFRTFQLRENRLEVAWFVLLNSKYFEAAGSGAISSGNNNNISSKDALFERAAAIVHGAHRWNRYIERKRGIIQYLYWMRKRLILGGKMTDEEIRRNLTFAGQQLVEKGFVDGQRRKRRLEDEVYLMRNKVTNLERSLGRMAHRSHRHHNDNSKRGSSPFLHGRGQRFSTALFFEEDALRGKINATSYNETSGGDDDISQGVSSLSLSTLVQLNPPTENNLYSQQDPSASSLTLSSNSSSSSSDVDNYNNKELLEKKIRRDLLDKISEIYTTIRKNNKNRKAVGFLRKSLVPRGSNRGFLARMTRLCELDRDLIHLIEERIVNGRYETFHIALDVARKYQYAIMDEYYDLVTDDDDEYENDNDEGSDEDENEDE